MNDLEIVEHIQKYIQEHLNSCEKSNALTYAKKPKYALRIGTLIALGGTFIGVVNWELNRLFELQSQITELKFKQTEVDVRLMSQMDGLSLALDAYAARNAERKKR